MPRPVDSAPAKMTAYITTEVVAIYLALLGIFNAARRHPGLWGWLRCGVGGRDGGGSLVAGDEFGHVGSVVTDEAEQR